MKYNARFQHGLEFTPEEFRTRLLELVAVHKEFQFSITTAEKPYFLAGLESLQAKGELVTEDLQKFEVAGAHEDKFIRYTGPTGEIIIQGKRIRFTTSYIEKTPIQKDRERKAHTTPASPKELQHINAILQGEPT